MDLTKLISESKEELTAWVEFGGFELEIIYTDRRGLERLLNNSRKREYDRKTHQPVETLNDALFVKQMATRVNDWRGLTLGKLRDLTNINLEGQDPGTVIPCTDSNKVALIDEVYGLLAFLRNAIIDLDAFRRETLEIEEKNSETSQGNESE